MATFYCDLVSGNDANDGLTTSTPKLTINGVTALVTAYTDECKVRGMDSLFTNIGNWTWTNESRVVTISGDLTGSVAANDYICKTVVASGTTVPEIYKVSTVAYAAGTNTTTITLLLTATYNYYVGTTETCATSKLVLPTAIAAQLINKNGFVNGTATDVVGRVLTKITGGWDATYTTQSTWTFLYGTVNNQFSFNGKLYWELNRFIVITTNSDCVLLSNYSNIKNCFLGWSNSNCIGGTGGDYSYHYNVKYIGSNADLFDRLRDYNLFENALIINSRTGDLSNLTYKYITFINSTIGLYNGTIVKNSNWSFINCKLINVDKIMISNTTYTDTHLTGCTIQDIGSTANIYFLCLGNIVNCTFDMNRNRTTGYITGNIYPITTYTFLNNSGATGQFMRHDLNGIIYNTTRFKLWQGANTFTNLKWYNTNNEDLGVSDFTSTLNYDYLLNNIIYNYTTGTTKNTRLSKYGYTTLSDDYYSGKTGTTGATNSVLHVVGTNNAACDFSNVDFVINKSNAYNLSFYAKGSGSYTLHWNILNGGEYVFSSWQTQAITAGAWQQITKAISASDWKLSGTATLVIRIPSQAAGTYALIDYIQLT